MEIASDEYIEVRNILDMYWQMKRTYQALPKDSTIRLGAIEFPGFDGNYETKQLGYARELCEGDEFSELYKGDNLNSHHPWLERYRAMLQQWLASPDKRQLTEKDLSRILSARFA